MDNHILWKTFGFTKLEGFAVLQRIHHSHPSVTLRYIGIKEEQRKMY
ncbi:hypothetical protein Q8G35_24830 [Peribacillus simplex]|uniref:Uncharacterized protein n=2 Tax=Peribacillus TaxID=2675229 RepID=A0AA90T3D0_9BACI|nr:MULTISPECIES: hypothetical protein [Peribacillus]MDP1421507.1 hypothetical protein [Peribacillus simplex]MDP1454244.1 hypothetical protein [Peribacillus frigoritolerans]